MTTPVVRQLTAEGDTESLVAALDRLTEAIERLAGSRPSAGPGPDLQLAPASTAGPTLGEAVEAYLTEKESSREWSENYQKIARTWLEHMAVFVGADRPVAEVSRDMLLQYRQHLAEAPKIGGGRRKASSVNTLLVHVVAFFRWAHELAGLIPEAPTQQLRLKESSGGGRKPFDWEDVIRVWVGMRTDAPTPAHFWVPTLCLFLGLRLEEAAGLRGTDFVVDRETEESFLDLTQAGTSGDDARTFKTPAARRRIPVPRALARMDGFDTLVRRRELFAEWCPEKAGGRRGVAVSMWFNRRCKGRALTEGVVLHSTRHTYSTELKRLGCPEYLIAQLLGHENANITTGRYGHEVPVDTLREWVEKIPFPEDLQ